MKNRKHRAFSFIIIMIFLSLISVAFFGGYQFLMFAISGIFCYWLSYKSHWLSVIVICSVLDVISLWVLFTVGTFFFAHVKETVYYLFLNLYSDL